MSVLGIILLVVQILLAVALIFIIAIQTTKSEQSGSGMGWGTIGGQASSSLKKFGLEAQLTRLTTWLAIGFFTVSILSAIVEAKMRSPHP